MPLRIRSRFTMTDLQDIQLAEPFSFTKGSRTMKIPARARPDAHSFGTLLFDVQRRSGAGSSIGRRRDRAMMIDHMVRLMRENDSPSEQFERMGLQAYL